jgi:hypothetical protein
MSSRLEHNDELTRHPFPLVGENGEIRVSIKEVKR